MFFRFASPPSLLHIEFFQTPRTPHQNPEPDKQGPSGQRAAKPYHGIVNTPINSDFMARQSEAHDHLFRLSLKSLLTGVRKGDVGKKLRLQPFCRKHHHGIGGGRHSPNDKAFPFTEIQLPVTSVEPNSSHAVLLLTTQPSSSSPKPYVPATSRSFTI